MTKEEIEKMAVSFALKHGFDIKEANPAHDPAHVISGYPPTKEGEELQNGWELAIMDVNPKNNLSLLEIEGFLEGCAFKEKNSNLANSISFWLQNL